MFGKSWSANNALMLATLKPPALKTAIALHATDDLFYNDVHYIDGVLHFDEYALSMDHENAFPQSPHYEIDDNYFNNRFLRSPWIPIYMKNQIDGPFWQNRSISTHYESIDIPLFLIGGLLDGYR